MIKRIDTIQPLMVETLRKLGVSVQPIHVIGKGCPDILCGWKNRNYLFEIKSDNGKLTPEEIRWHETWKGQVHTIHSVEEILNVLFEKR